MDIDDILAEVDPGPAAAPETVDLQDLTRAWVNEKNAPELLPWPEALVERVMERIRKQVSARLFVEPSPGAQFVKNLRRSSSS